MSQRTLFKLNSNPLDIDAQAERLYQEYPRKASKGDALTAIRKAIRDVGFAVLLEAIVEYAKACKATKKPQEYIPYPASWIRARKWEDDRTTWYAGADELAATESYTRLRKFAQKYGSRHPEINDADFHRAKNVAKACVGGWQAFVDGKVTLTAYRAAWKETR